MPWGGLTVGETIALFALVQQPQVVVYKDGAAVIARKSDGTELYRGTAGTNDAAAINAGIAGLTAGRTKKEKILLKGEFSTEDRIRLPSYTAVEINGKITLKASLAKNVFENSDDTVTQTQIEIYGGEIVGNAHNVTPNAGIYLGRVTECTIHDLIISNTGHVAIYFKGSHRCTIRNNIIKDCGEGTNTLVGTGIAFLGGELNAIINNIIKDCDNGGTIMAGIQVENDDQYSQGTFRDSLISGNQVTGNGGQGIIISNANRVTVLGNQVSSNDKDGLKMVNCAFCSISNNIMSVNGQGTNITYVEMNLEVNRSVIQGNQFYSNALAPRVVNGLVLADANGCSNNIVSNNYFEEMYNAGILVNRDGHQIKNNTILQAGGRCIRLETNADSCVVESNVLGGGASILVDDLGGGTTPNKVRGNKGYTTEANLLSGTFALDSTAEQSLTIAHGLNITPALKDIALAINTLSSAVTDWVLAYMYISAVDATNITVKLKLSTASATAGATAKVGVRVGRP